MHEKLQYQQRFTVVLKSVLLCSASLTFTALLSTESSSCKLSTTNKTCVLWLKHLSHCPSLMFFHSGMAHWTSGPEERNDWWLRGIRLSRMTQQMGGPPNSKWRKERMGANGSSYPHTCSPRIGGNAQAQQTFIGMYVLSLKTPWSIVQTDCSVCSVLHFFQAQMKCYNCIHQPWCQSTFVLQPQWGSGTPKIAL